METLTIKSQICVALPEAAKELNITRQCLRFLINSHKINRIRINGHAFAIIIEDLELLRNSRIKTSRPCKSNILR